MYTKSVKEEIMIQAITKANSISLYQWFEEKGFQGSKQNFDDELFNKDIFSFERVFISETEGQITGFIQYGKNSEGKGIIRLLHMNKEEEGKELLFRALTYFYMFHIDTIIVLDEKYGISNVQNAGMEMNEMVKNLFSSFRLSNVEAQSISTFHFVQA